MYCFCGHSMIQRNNIHICTICHNVFKKHGDKYILARTTAGIRETRELLDTLTN